MADGMAVLSDLAEALLELGPAERVSYAEAFVRARVARSAPSDR